MKNRIFRAAIFTPMARGRWGLPLLAWSKPGEGKSAILRELCESFGLPFITLSPGLHGEGAFGALPVPDKSGVIKYPPPDWTLEVKEGGVVFVDEITTAPPALQPPILALTLDAKIGFTTLHPRVRRIAAANPTEYAACGYDLNPAQANRFGHIEWEAPSVAEHAAYMMRGTTGHDGGGHADASATVEEERVLAAWNGGAWARAVALETSFLAARPALKNDCPKAGDPRASKAWPSDRSWENATRALASSQVHGLSEAETDEFVASFVGNEAYAEFKKFIVDLDLPDAAKLLDGDPSVRFTHNQARLDKTAAVLNACVTLVCPDNAPRRDDRTAAFWKILSDLYGNGASQDLVVVPAQQLIAAHLGANSPNAKVKAAYSVLGRQQSWVDLLRLTVARP